MFSHLDVDLNGQGDHSTSTGKLATTGALPPPGDAELERLAKAALQRVRDRELGLDVVALGLVQAVRAVDGRVVVDMTLSANGLQFGEPLLVDVAAAVANGLPDHHLVDVRLLHRWMAHRN